jgi:hypothetical protein
MDLGRFDHALEVLGDDASTEAREVRAEVFWKQRNWAPAAAIYEGLLGERFRTPGALTAAEEARLIRAGVGYSLGADSAALTRLSRNYLPFVAGARAKTALTIALDDDAGAGASPGDFTSLAASADTFAGWVAAVKAELRTKTGRNRPAAPARPA